MNSGNRTLSKGALTTLLLLLAQSVSSYAAQTFYLSPDADETIEREAFIQKMTDLEVAGRLSAASESVTLEWTPEDATEWLQPGESLTDLVRPLDLSESEKSYRHAYKNGDIVFLIGNLEEPHKQTEWGRFYKIAKWMVRNNFRSIVNPWTYTADLRAAVRSSTTTAIIWSSHGAEKDGSLKDSAAREIPTDAFVTSASSTFKHITLSNCHSEKTAKNYQFPSQVSKRHWEGITYTSELFNYLESTAWERDLKAALGVTEL